MIDLFRPAIRTSPAAGYGYLSFRRHVKEGAITHQNGPLREEFIGRQGRTVGPAVYMVHGVANLHRLGGGVALCSPLIRVGSKYE